ncbi:MAG: biotin/lipoyl-binding protein [Ramlibacter sp.]|nr:biotin/lipoyl-binding protein [Ramlibacter sp.]
MQRRHQKIIEETPSPAVDGELRERMGQCAVELAQAAGYVGAGTVEFLLEEGAFFLLEMNTRLQVEHPVTEAVTGYDLVEWQLRIACGEPLPRRQKEVRFSGHAIEVRLCAEDEDFTPHTGTIRKFLPPLPGEGRVGGSGGPLRFDHSIYEGLNVSPYYDSMLGKLISHAPTRAQALTQLTAALDDLQVLGLPTNRRFLAACLRHPVFAGGEALIPFLAEHGDELRRDLQDEKIGYVPEAAVAALLPRGSASALASPFERPLRVRHRDAVLDVPLREADGVAASQAAVVQVATGEWHVQVGAVDLFVSDASFEPPESAGTGGGSSEVRAPFNGKVIAVQATAGASVKKGDILLVIESMKLEHALAAPRDATVQSVHVEAGQQVATARVLLTLAAIE